MPRRVVVVTVPGGTDAEAGRNSWQSTIECTAHMVGVATGLDEAIELAKERGFSLIESETTGVFPGAALGAMADAWLVWARKGE